MVSVYDLDDSYSLLDFISKVRTLFFWYSATSVSPWYTSRVIYSRDLLHLKLFIGRFSKRLYKAQPSEPLTAPSNVQKGVLAMCSHAHMFLQHLQNNIVLPCWLSLFPNFFKLPSVCGLRVSYYGSAMGKLSWGYI